MDLKSKSVYRLPQRNARSLRLNLAPWPALLLSFYNEKSQRIEMIIKVVLLSI